MSGNIELAEEYRLAAEAAREQAIFCTNPEERRVWEAQATWWETRYVKLSSATSGSK
jgi:hypothetical protein